MLDYIEENLEGDLTIDSMASIAHLSRYHFARAFRQAMGQSPHRYVSVKRLERAKALLIQSECLCVPKTSSECDAVMESPKLAG